MSNYDHKSFTKAGVAIVIPTGLENKCLIMQDPLLKSLYSEIGLDAPLQVMRDGYWSSIYLVPNVFSLLAWHIFRVNEQTKGELLQGQELENE